MSLLSSFPLSEINHIITSQQPTLRHQQLQSCLTLLTNGTGASLQGFFHSMHLLHTSTEYMKAQIVQRVLTISENVEWFSIGIHSG